MSGHCPPDTRSTKFGPWRSEAMHATSRSRGSLQYWIFTSNRGRNESGFRPPLCTYRLNWARRTSWGLWDEWADTALPTQEVRNLGPGDLRPCTLPLGHGGSLQYWIFTSNRGRNIWFFETWMSERKWARDLRLSKQVYLTTAPGPPSSIVFYPWIMKEYMYLMTRSANHSSCLIVIWNSGWNTILEPPFVTTHISTTISFEWCIFSTRQSGDHLNWIATRRV